MSRPYININSSTYNSTTDVVTFDVSALRLRGETSLTVGGFTSSQTISLTSGRYLTQDSGNFTFSANLNGTSSNNLGSGGLAFSPATAVFEFSGTATGGTTKTVVKLSVFGSNGTGSVATQTYTIFGAGGYTFSATQSAANAVETLRTNISSLPTGATATSSGEITTEKLTPLIVSPPVRDDNDTADDEAGDDDDELRRAADVGIAIFGGLDAVEEYIEELAALAVT